ncbi:MAG: acetylxylan esterase [Caldilineaceae bacterium]|nr:acetylxylan esterase [Caldilineaceae bacterium]
MSTIRLTAQQIPALQPTIELQALAQDAPRYAFTATTLAEATAWQAACRSALATTLGFLDTPPVDPAPHVIEEVDRGDFVRRKVVISTAPQARMPVYLLIPKGIPGPLPVVIAYAGHGYGARDIVGLWEDGEERWSEDGYHKDFAIALCRRGFLVAAPEIAGFGERQTDYSYLNRELGQAPPTTCHNAATYAFMVGKSLVGLRIRDGVRLVDYLATLPEADLARLGAMGISGGGMATFFHAAIDERIKAAVISGYFSSFRDSILAMNHCTCNFVPGLLNIGEMSDIVGLITPRPLLIEAGTRDPIFPIATVRASVQRTREICALLGGDATQAVELDEFEGRHRISGRRAYDFLWEQLVGG